MRRVNEAAKVARGVKGGSMMIVAAAASLVLSGCVPSASCRRCRCARRPTMRSRYGRPGVNGAWPAPDWVKQ